MNCKFCNKPPEFKETLHLEYKGELIYFCDKECLILWLQELKFKSMIEKIDWEEMKHEAYKEASQRGKYKK